MDAEDLAFVDQKNGEHFVSLEVATVISDSRSLRNYSKGIKCDFYIT
jgi:hypothetical protein